MARWTGTWGDISTQGLSTMLTMGEGGAINIVRDKKLKKIAESFVIGEEIVGVLVVWIIAAIRDLAGNWENYQKGMTTNTHTVILDIT